MTLPDAVVRAIRLRCAEVQRDARLPSLSVGIKRGGGQPLAFGVGDPQPVADVQYRIGSITKTFTAVLVMQLRDEGLVRLDDPVRDHVPAAPAGPLLIRDLLGHLSGLRREPPGDFWEASPGHTADAMLASLHPDDVLLPTRRAWHYSNVAYGLLGLVVERLRGMSYAQALHQRVLDPLDLRRTTYAPASPHAVGLRVHPFADTVVIEPVPDTLVMAPAGQLWSTPTDLCAWGAFLADPVHDVLAPATVDEMADPVVLEDPEQWTSGNGLGLQLFRRGERVFAGHGGSMPGFSAGLAVSRRDRVTAAVCTNAWGALDGATLACDLLVTALDGDPQPPTPWHPSDLPTELDELLGTWWWRGLQFVAYASDGHLFLAPTRDARTPRAPHYKPAGHDLFVGASGMNRGEHLRIVRNHDGHITHLDIGTFIFTRDLT